LLVFLTTFVTSLSPRCGDSLRRTLPRGRHDYVVRTGGMLVERFTFVETARRIGLRCQQFRLHGDRVTLRKYLQIRQLYRATVEAPHDRTDADPEASAFRRRISD
jgi:hypothetical protein